MKGEVLSALESAAYGAKLAAVESVPDFPAPFASDISSEFGKGVDVFEMESVSSAVAAAVGASLAGKRVFLPVSTPLAQEAFAAPFLRAPFVMVNVSRSLHNVRSDLSAVMTLRDAGYIMFFPENNQEIYDTVFLSYKVCEDPTVMLPALINIDGLANIEEPVQTANDQSVKGFLGRPAKRVDVKKPAPIDVYSDHYGEDKLLMAKAMENVPLVMKKVAEKWYQKYKRPFSPVEKFMTDDAETIIVTMGYHSSTAKAAVRHMRSQGKKVGLLRIFMFRPWPAHEVASALEKAKKIMVFEQAVSTGVGGILSAHIKRHVSQFICLGKYPEEKDFSEALAKVEKSPSDIKIWM